MQAALQALLALIAQIAPSLGASATIQNVINTLIQILPVILQTAESLVPHVKEIITILTSNPATLPDQVKQLQDLSAQCDADFDAAADAAAKEDSSQST